MKRVRRLVARIPRPKCIAPGGSEAAENNNSKKSFSELNPKPTGEPPVVYKCGLNPRQAFLLKQSFKAIMREEDFGVEFHLRLFKTDKSLQSMFQKFKDISSDDDLRSNEALEYHATMVMTTLDEAITRIDNYDFVQDLLRQTGASHKRFENFEPITFLNIKQPFLEAVKVTLGDRYTENMEKIYTIAINFLVDTMVEGMQDSLGKDEPAPIAPVVRKSMEAANRES